MRSRISVAGHNFSAASNQQFQNPKGLRRQFDAVAAPPELAGSGVELEGVETKDRGGIHSSKTHATLKARPW